MAPASPKEKRRSARRSAHSSSKSSGSSGSPSPDAAPLPPPPSASEAARSAASSSTTSAARGKRAKDDTDAFHAPAPPSHRRTASIASTVNGAFNAPAPPSASSKRTKRKGKDIAVPADDPPDVASADAVDSKLADVVTDGERTEEDGGITRCVCEGLDDDADAPEFMIQCEQCMAWQHGPCMGFSQESEIPEGDYYCEQCRPGDHVELLKRLARRQRHSSEKSAQNSQKSRSSRSHSPTHFLKTAKRRNTMNSRDAAYEESIRELLDATAAEASPNVDTPGKDRAESVAKTEEPNEDIIDTGPAGRKKRKRIEDDVMSVKRKRSVSVISEGLGSVVAAQDKDKPEATTPITTALLPPPAPSGKSRARRGGGKKGVVAREASVNGEGEEGLSTTKKHPNQYTYRAKASNGQSRRAPQSGVSQTQQGSSTHEHGTRRNANNGANSGTTGAGSRNNHNAYYNNVQLPMFSNWGLPDYLAHLQSILPSEVPSPLQIRGATSFLREDLNEQSVGSGEAQNSAESGRGSVGPMPSEAVDVKSAQMTNALANATESVTERGVKVKWPAKRMSVADMNKRVRSLVEWVGREQALALDRERRKAALENALGAHLENRRSKSDSPATLEKPKLTNGSSDENLVMVVDSKVSAEMIEQEQHLAPESDTSATPKLSFAVGLGMNGTRPSTSKMMEELMEDLIIFQERFGPSAKGQARERRFAGLS